MPQTITDFEIFLKNQTEYLTVFVRDPKTDELTDVVGTSTFNLIDISDDSNVVTRTFTANGGTDIVHPSQGVYQFSLDTATYTKEYLASFRCLLDGETIVNNIYVKTAPSAMFAHASELRVMVDKARKSISDDIENMDKAEYEPATKILYGFDDRHLIYYLERGAQIINVIPPYTNFSPITFPWAGAGTILIDGGVIAALESQGIFAIDTDFNYSLGGNSLVIDHFTKINSFLSTLLGRFDTNVMKFKQQFRGKGTILYTFLPGGTRTARMLNALPSGFYSRILSSSFV